MKALSGVHGALGLRIPPQAPLAAAAPTSPVPLGLPATVGFVLLPNPKL